MKYGVLYFKNTWNIGDDIWAYAQSRFYPRIDYTIDNTSVYKFKSADDEPVAVIMSAYVTPYNYEYTFCVPPNIIPYFVGSAFGPTLFEFLEKNFIYDYLKNHTPLGVRSEKLAEKFRDMGIDAYFSGCITLTLPEFPKQKQEKEYICLVDVPDYVVDCVKATVGDKYDLKVMTHITPKLDGQTLAYDRSFETDYSESISFKERCNLSIEHRFEIAEKLIRTYADAHCVIISRLHAALPSLAQKTPVLLTLPKDRSGIVDMDVRFSGYYNLLHHCHYDDFLNGGVDYDFENPPKNTVDYLILRKRITSMCNEFIKNCENGNIISKSPATDQQRKDRLIEVLQEKVYQLKCVVDAKNRIISQKDNTIAELQKRIMAIIPTEGN